MKPDNVSHGRNYYPHLDTLRFFAAIGVVNLHWFKRTYFGFFGINREYDWSFGGYGVQLFFIISGFLITEILIKNKLNKDLFLVIKSFFFRRVLRLFPIYYLVILILIFLKNNFVISNLGWYIFYAANVNFYLEGGLKDILSNHLWTLSVEEQFYLLFPTVFLFVKRKVEFIIPLVFIVTAWIVKIYFGNGIFEHDVIQLLTFSQLDMLGFGIALAILKNRHKIIWDFLTKRVFKTMSIFLLFTSITLFYYLKEVSFYTWLFPLIFSLTLILLVTSSIDGFQGLIGNIFAVKILNYFGKISYGIYLYHKITPLIISVVLKKIDLTISNVALYYIINLSLLLTLSHLSWIYIERWFINLKGKYSYS